jgi:hypothetical protein
MLCVGTDEGSAAVLYLKSGQSAEGKVVRCTDRVVIMESGGEQSAYLPDEIQRIRLNAEEGIGLDELCRTVLFGQGASEAEARTESPAGNAQVVRPLKTYVDDSRGIHLQYPAEWHVRTDQNNTEYAVFISRELVVKPPDTYRVGISIMHFEDLDKKMPDFSEMVARNPNQGAVSWLWAVDPRSRHMRFPPLVTERQGRTYYLTEELLSEGTSYPIMVIRVFSLSGDSVRQVLFESPQDEFEVWDEIFYEIINAPGFEF